MLVSACGGGGSGSDGEATQPPSTAPTTPPPGPTDPPPTSPTEPPADRRTIDLNVATAFFGNNLDLNAVNAQVGPQFTADIERFLDPLLGLIDPNADPDKLVEQLDNPLLPSIGRARFSGTAIISDADAVAQSYASGGAPPTEEYFVVTGVVEIEVDFGSASTANTLIGAFIDPSDTQIPGQLESDATLLGNNFRGGVNGAIGERRVLGSLDGLIFNKLSNRTDLAIVGNMQLGTNDRTGAFAGDLLGAFTAD